MDSFSEGPKNVEVLSDWRERRDTAPDEAQKKLEELGLPATFESISKEDVERAVSQLPELIQNVSYDVNGTLINENKYVARFLSVYLEKARRMKSALEIELPLAA
jgi:hypothetical protein